MSTDQRIGQSAGEGRGFFKPWMKVALVTIIFAVPAMALGNVIWPPAEGGPEPTSGQVASFIILAVLTALTFGLGISFLLFGFPLVRKVVGGSKLRVWAAYLSIGWLLVSWWPHGSLHAHVGENIQQLLYIEYGFHVPSYLAGLVLAYCFVAVARERSDEAASGG